MSNNYEAKVAALKATLAGPLSQYEMANLAEKAGVVNESYCYDQAEYWFNSLSAGDFLTILEILHD